ncbi:MAG: hypothetical protein M3371_15940 [Acidobacteriota bacterium]|nr:hypothetical protein [Acidobacteriota bacterium]
MAEQVLEGTWEEIVQHAEEFSGKRVRLTVIEKSLSPQAEQPPVEERPLSELLEGLIGVIDSREPCPPPIRRRDAFGEGVVEKLRKQGLKLP